MTVPTAFTTNPTINYGYGNYTDNYELPNSRKQPIFSVSNTTTWTKGTHSLRFGGNWYREVNQVPGIRRKGSPTSLSVWSKAIRRGRS